MCLSNILRAGFPPMTEGACCQTWVLGGGPCWRGASGPMLDVASSVELAVFDAAVEDGAWAVRWVTALWGAVVWAVVKWAAVEWAAVE